MAEPRLAWKKAPGGLYCHAPRGMFEIDCLPTTKNDIVEFWWSSGAAKLRMCFPTVDAAKAWAEKFDALLDEADW